MKLHNTLTKHVDELVPLHGNSLSIYSCGPTVYDHAHIGNLCAFIAADVLRRVITANGYQVKHVMNFTDVDDKTIRRSRADYPKLAPMDALRALTKKYADIFLDDMERIGNDTELLTFINAANDDTIEAMKKFITRLHADGFAYIADDGIYFSIEAYKKSGKIYGQLVELSDATTSHERIHNDEYDKESVHDFAVWKKQKEGEPAWSFALNGTDMTGRPGWHIECSVMSRMELGQPFDIHTGGIDLAFPHHENEIAQSTASNNDPTYARVFVHNEHILVNGRKMSKSLGNFFTLDDLTKEGVNPLAFRLLVLQSHYRKQTNFSFDNVEAANNRLQRWRNMAALRWQVHDTIEDDNAKDNIHDVNGVLLAAPHAALERLNDDLDTPGALVMIEQAFDTLEQAPLRTVQHSALLQLFEWIDQTLGLHLLETTPDIPDEAKKLILERRQAREQKNWETSDAIRDELKANFSIDVLDQPSGTVWQYS